jgi:hypothetical protein
MRTQRFLTAASRIARVSFELICGDGGARKAKVGTSPSRAGSSAPSTALTFRRRHPDDMDLKCCFCIFVRQDIQPAITVMNGHAVCEDHNYYVQGGDFAKILRMIAGDEIKKER